MADTEYREFEVEVASGKKVTLTVRSATNQELQDAEFEYSRGFNNALMSGIMPQARLIAELTENGIWTEDDDKKIDDQRQVVIKLEDALDEAEEEEDKKRIAENLREERMKLYSMRQARTDILSHSAESKAEEAQRNFLVSRVIEHKDTGRAVWKTYADYKEDEDANLLFRATYEYMTFVNGLPSDFIDNLPENNVGSEEEAEGEQEEQTEQTEQAEPAEAPDSPPAEATS
jgi:hypothetical protein